MILLYEAPEGFALFKVLDEGKLSNVEDLGKEFSSPDSARKMVRLIDFYKLTSEEALDAATKLMKGTPSKDLLYFLKLYCHGEALAVADSKLGHAIKKKLKIDFVHNNAVLELLRGVRSQFPELVSGVDDLDLARPVGLSHSLARYKLTEKREPEPDNTMGLKYLDMLEVRFKKLHNVEEAEEETLMYGEELITAADSLPGKTPEDSEKLITAAQTPKVSEEPLKKKDKKNYNVEEAEEDLNFFLALVEETYNKDKKKKKKKKMEEEEPEEEPSKKEKVEEELTSPWAQVLSKCSYNTAADSLPEDSEEPSTAADSLPGKTPEDSEKLITAAQTPKVSEEPSKKKYKKNYNVEKAEEDLKFYLALIEEIYNKDKKEKKMEEEEEPEEEPSKKEKVEDELTSWAQALIRNTYNIAADSLLGQTPAKSEDCEEPSKKMEEEEEPEKVEPSKKKKNAEEEESAKKEKRNKKRKHEDDDEAKTKDKKEKRKKTKV